MSFVYRPAPVGQVKRTLPHAVELEVNFDDEMDDYRRIRAEHWCQLFAIGEWLRRIETWTGIARFEFADHRDAMEFWLSH